MEPELGGVAGGVGWRGRGSLLEWKGEEGSARTLPFKARKDGRRRAGVGEVAAACRMDPRPPRPRDNNGGWRGATGRCGLRVESG